MKALILATAMAVGFASYANAAEVKKDTKARVVASKAMSDADLDKVTAGTPGFGQVTAQFFAEGNPGWNIQYHPGESGVVTGLGRITAYSAQN